MAAHWPAAAADPIGGPNTAPELPRCGCPSVAGSGNLPGCSDTLESTCRTSTELHAPQDWPQYAPPYFAAFWMDRFGFMLEAVCHHDQ
jgi:hypothetical protein